MTSGNLILGQVAKQALCSAEMLGLRSQRVRPLAGKWDMLRFQKAAKLDFE